MSPISVFSYSVIPRSLGALALARFCAAQEMPYSRQARALSAEKPMQRA